MRYRFTQEGGFRKPGVRASLSLEPASPGSVALTTVGSNQAPSTGSPEPKPADLKVP